MLRLTRHTWLCLGLLVATLLASLGPATTTPARAAARMPAPAAPSATIRHSHLPPRGIVPAPLRQAGNGTVVRFHGRRILTPTHAHLIPTLHALLSGAATSRLRAPRPRGATHPAGRHVGLQQPLAPRALAASAAPPAPPPPVTIDGVLGRFYYSPHNGAYYTASDGVFDIPPGMPPLFTQQFSALDFDPPPTAQHCSNPITVNGRAVDSWTRPFVDVIPQPDGTCTLQIAQGNGVQAGVDLSGQGGENLEVFEAAFTAHLTVQQAGPLTLHFYADDGWILAIGKDTLGHQPTRDPNSSPGSYQTAPGYTLPTSGWLTGYPVVGTDDQTSPPAANNITVDFPAAGTYPIEVDYTECCQGELAPTLGSQYGDPLLPGTISSLSGDLNRTPQNCPCSQAQLFWGGPFNTRTGNLSSSATDLVVSTPGPPLDWVRTYNSQATGDADQPGALGYGWQEPYATHLITAGAPGVAIVVSATGNRLRFQDLGNGRFRAFPGVYGTLAETGGVYTETLRTQEQVIFNRAGQATSLRDGHGGQLTLQYNGTQLTRIVDAADSGRFLALDYDPTGSYIVAVHDPTGRSVRYTYNSDGDLVGTTDVMNRTVTYPYQNHLLTEIDNALGQPQERTTYDVDDPTGKVIGQTLADGERFAVASVSTTITTTGRRWDVGRGAGALRPLTQHHERVGQKRRAGAADPV